MKTISFPEFWQRCYVDWECECVYEYAFAPTKSGLLDSQLIASGVHVSTVT